MLARGGLPDAIVARRSSLSRSLDGSTRLIRPLGLPDRRLVLSPTGPLGGPRLEPAALADRLPGHGGRPSAPPGCGPIRPTRPAGPGCSPFAGPGLRHAEARGRGRGRARGPARSCGPGPRPAVRAAAALSAARLVHLAAHGTHQAENPLFSSIRLADGPIFAYELDDSAARGRARGAVGLRARPGDGPARRRGPGV